MGLVMRLTCVSVRAMLPLILAFAARSASPAEAVGVVEYREVDLTYPAEAVVEAVSQATVAAQVQGRVVQVRVDVGDRVKRGDLLMRIDEREATQAVAGSEAHVAQAQAQLTNAKSTYERTKNLYAQKFVSSAALDQAEASYKAAQAQLEAALANRGQTSTTRSFTAINAPLTGVVAQRHTELGEMAAPGKPLLTLYDPKGLRVVANVPQYKLAEVSKSSRAKVELPETGRWIDAAAVTVLPVADARTHVVRVRITLPDNTQGVLPGMFARAHFVVGKAKKLLVPTQAIVRRGEISAVYVLDGQGMPQLRQVRLGETADAGSTEILAGLAPGEQVALDPVQAGIRLKQAAGR